jgi:ketosteroid isomerase-like protein
MTTGTSRDIRAVLDHHIQALGEGFDSLLSDYAEDAVVFAPSGPVHGHEAIRAYFETFFGSLPPGLLPALKIIRQDVDGEIAYQNWTAEPYVPLGTDTFVVRDGKIKVQTWAGYIPS